MSRVAGVDVGGTNIVAALVDDEHRIGDRRKTKTPADGPEAVLARIVELVGTLEPAPEAVGVGAPGPVRDGVVQTAPNLPGWIAPVAVAAELAAALALPVVVGNDANVGALGESVAGAGRGAKALLGVWLGTGVGGGLVLDGRLYEGATGAAGEFGHMVVQRGGALCGCGRRGCVEAYAGRASMERAVAVAVAAGRSTRLTEIQDEKAKRRLTAGVWAQALAEDDPLATQILDEAVAVLGVAIGASVNLLDLDRVVVGGGLAEKLGQPLAERLTEATQPWLLVADDPPAVVLAALGDDAGVVGAAALARA